MYMRFKMAIMKYVSKEKPDENARSLRAYVISYADRSESREKNASSLSYSDHAIQHVARNGLA